MIAQEPREIRIGDGLARTRIGIVVGARNICHSGGGEAGGRRAVHTRNRALGRARDTDAVVNIRDRLCRIVRRAVIDLCYVSKLDSQGTRRNRARIAARERLRCRDRRYTLRTESVVLRLYARAGIEGRRIGHTLRGCTVVHTVPYDIRRGVFRRRRIRARLVVDKAGERDERIAARDIAVAVGLVVHRVVDLRDVVVFDRRRQRLRCDLARTRRMERAAQTLLDTTVHDVVVGEFVVVIVIRMPRHLIGELFDILHILAVGGTVILCEMPLAARECKRDMIPVAFDQPRRTAGHGIRGDIDIRARRVLVVAVVDLFCIELRMGRLVIDIEVVPEDLARDDLAIEVDGLIRRRNERLCVVCGRIVEFIVARVVAL